MPQSTAREASIGTDRNHTQANREWLLFCFMAIKLAAVARPAARHRQQPACQGRRRSSRLPAARPRQGQHRSLPAAPLSAGAGVASPAQPGRRCPAAQPAGPGARQGRRAACCCATWQWGAAGRWCSGRRPWTRVACDRRDRSAIADRIDQRQDDSCRGSRKYRGAKGAFHPPKYKRKKKKREKILQMAV